MGRIRESQGEETAYASTGRLGLRALLEKGSLDGGQGFLGRLKGPESSPVSET